MTEGLTIRNMIIMVLLAICVIAGTGYFIGDFSSTYNVTSDTSYINESLEYVNRLEESAENLRDAVTNFKWYNPLGYFEGVKAVMSLLWNAGTITGDFLTGIPIMFEIGGLLPIVWFMGVLSVIVIIIIVLELLSLYFKVKV